MPHGACRHHMQLQFQTGWSRGHTWRCPGAACGKVQPLWPDCTTFRMCSGCSGIHAEQSTGPRPSFTRVSLSTLSTSSSVQLCLIFFCVLLTLRVILSCPWNWTLIWTARTSRIIIVTSKKWYWNGRKTSYLRFSINLCLLEVRVRLPWFILPHICHPSGLNSAVFCERQDPRGNRSKGKSSFCLKGQYSILRTGYLSVEKG